MTRHIVMTVALALPLALPLAGARGAEAEPAPPPNANAAGAKAPDVVRPPLPPFGRVRVLEGEEYGRAVEARDSADLLRAGHEGRYHPGPAYPKGDAACDADFAGVVAAYRDASAKFPGTDVDCYCRQRLAGAYQYRGDFARALDESKRSAELFVNTPLAAEAQMSVGLIYLQALHRPRDAEPWFLRVQAAATGREARDPQRDSPQERDARDAHDAAQEGKWLAAASQALARCREEIRAQEVKDGKAEPDPKANGGGQDNGAGAKGRPDQ